MRYVRHVAKYDGHECDIIRYMGTKKLTPAGSSQVLSPVALNTRKSCDLYVGQHTWGLLGSIAGSAPRYRPCRICRAASALLPCRYRHHNLDNIDDEDDDTRRSRHLVLRTNNRRSVRTVCSTYACDSHNTFTYRCEHPTRHRQLRHNSRGNIAWSANQDETAVNE